MAFELTPGLAGGSLIIALIGYVIAFVLQFYMLYLNWKQSKVKETTTELVNEVRAIRKLLEQRKRGK